jgi:hypothetical protein
MLCAIIIYVFITLKISIGEVEEVVSSIVISSHTPATNSISNQSWEPGNSPEFSIKVLNPPSLNNIIFEATKHVVEVKVLVS